jgi:hypothetical protein
VFDVLVTGVALLFAALFVAALLCIGVWGYRLHRAKGTLKPWRD